MTNSDVLEESIRLIKANRKAEAQLVLEPYIQANPQDIQAWMWEAELFPEDADKIKVMEICLEHNPDHPQVLRAMEILRARSGIQAPQAPEMASAPIPMPVQTTPDPFLPAPPAPAERQAFSTPADSPLKGKPVRQPAAPGRAKPPKHPDWLTTEGIVDVSEIREMGASRVPMYQANIRAMYVVNGKDYQIRHPGARRTSIAPMDAEILTSNYTPGSNVTVRYDPKRPWKAMVDDWEPAETKRKLRQFKGRPEVRQALAKRHRKRMLTGLGWAAGGIVATLVGTLVFSKLGTGYYVVFGGAIAYGVITFISGLVGWLWYWD